MRHSLLATSETPCCVVTFTSRLRGAAQVYAEVATATEQLVARQDGSLWARATRGEGGHGIVASNSGDVTAIKAWIGGSRKALVQEFWCGRRYESIHPRTARVERIHTGPRAGYVVEG